MTETFGILLIGLLILDLLFALVRASLLNARAPLLMERAEHNPRAVERTIALLEKPRLRTSLRAGVVINHFLLITLVFWMLQGFYTLWIWLGVSVLSGLLLLLIEYALEGLILPHAEEWALRLTGMAHWMDVLFSPVSALLLLLLGSPEMLTNRRGPVTEYELKTWVEEDQPAGSLEKGEREMIYSIFHFGDTLCREIMVPRINMLALDITTTLTDAIRVLSESGHSRVPIYEDSVDNIVGLLYSKDLLRVKQEDQDLSMLRSILRPAYFVPEAKKVDELLEEMQSRRVHMAVVVDEYGGVAGLVTLEDIIEEIVGEIRDEYDQSEEQIYQEIGPEEGLFQGRISLDDFNKIMNSHLDTDMADTLGGLIYELMGRVPVGGETLEVEGLQLIVENVSGRQIRKVRARRVPLSSETKEKKDVAES